jgi:tetratricopeptide (TPR) repeat protein
MIPRVRRRRNSVPSVLVVAVCAVAIAAVLRAQSDLPSSGSPKTPSRSERLEAWLSAIESHEPARGDKALSVFDSWRPDEYQALSIDVGTLSLLIDNPKLGKFYWKPQGQKAAVPIAYSASDLARIASLAKAAAARGAEGGLSLEERLARNRNHILKRGAILHGDLAAEQIRGVRLRTDTAHSDLQQLTLSLSDGRQSGFGVKVGHWEMARLLLDKVVPHPGQDEFVRRWYIASAEYLQALGQLMPEHFARGLRVFPEDADLLFLAGCLHEALAEPRVQDAVQNSVLPTDVTFEVASKRAELKEAESFFRKALKVQPDHLEAGLHLGRVLGLRGEHSEAATLLLRAVADAKEPLLQYYAHLFLGAEVEALGDRIQARDLYTRAAMLYPQAQSPKLALSLMSWHDGNHAGALGAMASVLAVPGDGRTDPWWIYYGSQGRSATDKLTAIYAQFLENDSH